MHILTHLMRDTPGKTKILILEDNMPLALLMVDLLSRAECDVEVATTAKEGLQLAEKLDFDLIALNVNLPDANGFSVCSHLKRHPRLNDTPIVFISGCSSLEDQQHGLDVGAADYITKPFEPFEFVPQLLSHIKLQNHSAIAI